MEIRLWDKVHMEALFGPCGCLEQHESSPAQGGRAFRIRLVGKEPWAAGSRGREGRVGSALPGEPRQEAAACPLAQDLPGPHVPTEPRP